MTAEKKKVNCPARIPPRDKQSHAQYVWIKEMFARQTRLETRLAELEVTVKFIKDELNKMIQENQGD